MKTIVVSKAGIGQDRYHWDETQVHVEHATLLLYDRQSGELLHFYSPDAWLEVTMEETMIPLELFETDWNRPLQALFMILVAIIIIVVITQVHKWLK